MLADALVRPLHLHSRAPPFLFVRCAIARTGQQNGRMLGHGAVRVAWRVACATPAAEVQRRLEALGQPHQALETP